MYSCISMYPVFQFIHISMGKQTNHISLLIISIERELVHIIRDIEDTFNSLDYQMYAHILAQKSINYISQ